MGNNDYYLSWDNYKTTISSGFNLLLKNETLVDVTLAADGKYIKAHRTVLSVCSSFFKELFEVNPCKHPIVILPNVNYNDLCNLLQFMYQGEVSISQEEISTFIKLAEMLKIKGLTTNTNTLTSTSNLSVKQKIPKVEEISNESITNSYNLVSPSNEFGNKSNYEEILIKPKEEPLDDSGSLACLKFEVNDLDLEESSIMNELSTKNEEFNDDPLIVSDDDSEESSSCHQNNRKRRNVDLLPDKSKVRYIREYISFKEFCERKNIDYKTETEKAMLEYLIEKSEIMKWSSLSVKYVMIKATLGTEDNIHLKYPKVVAFLKRKAIGYTSTRTRTFTRDDINKFLTEAPDNVYLMMKVVLMIGVTGGCRTRELTMMTIDDIEDKGTMLIVKLPSNGSQIQRTFIINQQSTSNINFVDVYRKYMKLRQGVTEQKRLFVQYKEGKCTNQAIGRKTFGAIPRLIAKFLQKPNLVEYTGNCYRKTSAKLMANTGVMF